MTPKNLFDILAERRSTPSFDGTPLLPEDLHKLLSAAVAAPSGYNVQPWRFVVVQSPEQKKRLRSACYNQAKVEEASAVIVCCGDADGWRRDADEITEMGVRGGMPSGYAAQLKPHVEQYLSAFSTDQMHGWLNKQVAIAATCMMLAAEALGYDTAMMEGFDQEKIREVLRLPLSYWVVELLAVGHLKGPDKYNGGRFEPARVSFAEEFGKPLR